ncbi:MAG TPA: error-prone DNA polymerase [Planctomycetaceae bacterium]|nr:error-prone DNA polymerase [Planctomycetaceae bacterium]
MPELPPTKLHVPAPATPLRPPGTIRYAELHCKTNYSFLEGASHPDELVATASALGYTALAITDRNSVAGVVRAHIAAKDAGLKLVIGAELHPTDAAPLVVWAMNRAGYGRLCRLITRGRRNAPKGECRFTFADVAEHAEGLLAGLPLASLSGSGEQELRRWREVFDDRLVALAELHRSYHDARRWKRWQRDSATVAVPLVAGGDVHYHEAARRYLHDIVTAIRLKTTVAGLGVHRFSNSERHLRSLDELATLYAGCPAASRRSAEIAERCQFSLDELSYDYPKELCPAGETPFSYLSRLTWAGARNRYPAGIPDKVRRLVEHELTLIEQLRYAAYFLTVWDLVRFAREREILCQGRGSAANSVVCYCLGVTSVDPEKIDVLFERFVSKERDEAPDIDVDFEHQRREEVLQYIYEKYGRERAGMTAEVITYRPRSAVRDVGKALGLSLDRVDALAKSVDHFLDNTDKLPGRFRETGFDPVSRLGKQLRYLVKELLGFPRHLSQHVGGMVLTHRPLCELVPIENASMPGRTVVQWDKNDLDALGILKVDCLALGMLSAIRRGFDLLKSHGQPSLTLATVPQDDPLVYRMMQQADTVGVFQIESRAQMSMLPRLKPKEYYDLVIEVAIVRPGPIQGDMVHPYLRRRSGQEAVTYPNPAVEEVLSRTLGVPLFQEQAMRLAIVAAGFTPGEADQLRRAMGAWRRTGVMERFERKLIDGMTANGYTKQFARNVFQQIQGFGSYGFPESHAASFALLVYVSAWLKCHHPAAFLAALLNSQPMGFYAPAQLVSDARKHGVEVRPVDVNHSEWDSILEPEEAGGLAVRMGWSLVKGLPQSAAETVVRIRESGPFLSYADFTLRTGFSAAILTRFAAADAFRTCGTGRRPALWQSLGHDHEPGLFAQDDEDLPAALPELPQSEEVIYDYLTVGLSLRGHPFGPLRKQLDAARVVKASDLASLEADRRYRVAGMVLLRQRPSTAKGITFMTIEDESGQANLIVRPEVWERFRRVARGAGAIIATGFLQRQEGVTHLLVDRMQDLTAAVAKVGTMSRDFQ